MNMMNMMASVGLLIVGMLCSALGKSSDATSPHVIILINKYTQFFLIFKNYQEVDGTMVGARVRCQGFLCPQWALDISRYVNFFPLIIFRI